MKRIIHHHHYIKGIVRSKQKNDENNIRFKIK